MRRLRWLVVVSVLGLVVVSIYVFPTTASAEETSNPQILPTPTVSEPLKFTGEGGSTVFEMASGNSFKCTSYTYKGEMTSGRSGTGTIDFSTCESKGAKCKTEGDASGTILDHGALHVVDIEQAGKLSLAIQANLSEVANLIFACGVLKIEVKGAIIALASGVTSGVKLKAIKGADEQTKGKQAVKECALPLETCFEETKAKEKVHKKFLLEANAGESFVETGMETKGEVKFEKEVSVDF
jgi:hypothetical protein